MRAYKGQGQDKNEAQMKSVQWQDSSHGAQMTVLAAKKTNNYFG